MQMQSLYEISSIEMVKGCKLAPRELGALRARAPAPPHSEEVVEGRVRMQNSQWAKLGLAILGVCSRVFAPGPGHPDVHA